MGFSVMLWGAEKLVPAEYWCPYGTARSNSQLQELSTVRYLESCVIFNLSLDCMYTRLTPSQTKRDAPVGGLSFIYEKMT